jgi:hypothetical protein
MTLLYVALCHQFIFSTDFHMDSRQKYCKFHSQHRFFTLSQGGQKMVWEKQVVLGRLLTKMLFCS